MQYGRWDLERMGGGITFQAACRNCAVLINDKAQFHARRPSVRPFDAADTICAHRCTHQLRLHAPSAMIDVDTSLLARSLRAR